MKSGLNHKKLEPLPKRPLPHALPNHWPEYLMEAAALGIFMISAGAFTVLFEYPNSPVHLALPNADFRRFLIGVAMGSTAMALIYSPWGKRSGAHMNPAVTLTFLRLGRIPVWDAFFYCIFQFLGGLAGVLVTKLVLGKLFTEAPVTYVVTVPGAAGSAAAFFGEFIIAVIMMTMILYVSNQPSIARFTGFFAGILIMCNVTFEAPFSGFGMNPARTLASAVPSGVWTDMWIYLTAAPAGMLLAAEAYLLVKRLRSAPAPVPVQEQVSDVPESEQA